MNEGWVKLYRCLFKKALWLNSTPEQKVIMITLLGMANHEGREWEWQGKHFKARSGEFVTSANSIIERTGTGISRQNVRTALTRFKKHNFLTYESTRTGMLIRIVNWGFYQGENSEDNHPANQRVIKKSSSINQPLTTNKNDNNNKNNKKYEKIYEYTNNKRLIETIVDFIKMRKEIKKPMTDRALKLMLNQLKTLSEDEEMQIKILEKSIQNCWQGIFKIQENSNTFVKSKFGKRIGNGIYPKELIGDVNGNYDMGKKEDGYGSIGSNNGAAAKKFNIKIPKWDPDKTKGECVWDEPV